MYQVCTRLPESLTSVNDRQQQPQSRSATKKCINPDSWELDVVGVNRHLLEIMLLMTSKFQLPN